jgi:hypothetical protein
MPRGGSKPGERRGGRKKGTPNKTPKEVKLLAQQHTEAAIERLAYWMMQDDDPAASVKAASTMLDRGWGKAVQQVEVKDKTERRLSYAQRLAAEDRARAAQGPAGPPVGNPLH